MRWQLMLQWPPAHLRQIGGALLAGAVFLLVDALLTPRVDAIYPVELTEPGGESAPTVESKFEGVDFVTRPLFVANRRPMAPVVIEETIPEPVTATVESSLEGWDLLGVFASGGEGGAIIQLEDGTRTRLLVGDALDGWSLTATSLRGAVFSAGSGATAELELAVASTLPKLEIKTQAASPPVPSPEQSGDPASPAEQPPERKAKPMSFDSVWESKKAAKEAERAN